MMLKCKQHAHSKFECGKRREFCVIFFSTTYHIIRCGSLLPHVEYTFLNELINTRYGAFQKVFTIRTVLKVNHVLMK